MAKERIKKIVLGILTVVLIGYISIGIVFYSLLNISKNYINKNKMENIINNIDISQIIKDNIEIENIKNELLDIGISDNSIEQFFNSEELIKFEEEAITNIVYDILNKGNIEYTIDTEKINSLLYNNIKELQSSNEYTELKEKLNNKLPNLVDIMNDMIDKVSLKLQNSTTFQKYKNTINEMFKVFDIIYSKFVNCLIIFVILSFVALLIYIRTPKYKSLKWLGLSFVIPSIILKFFAYLLLQILKSSKFEELSIVINNDFNSYFMKYFIVGILLIVINISIYIWKKRNSKLNNKLNNK